MKLIQDLGMIYPLETSKIKSRYGLYSCECGNQFRAKMQHIKDKKINSCGCYRKNKISEIKTKHGLRKHRLYKTWDCMINRCNNLNNISYINYGLRGIRVCTEWLDIKNFINDMYPTFKEGLTLDRIDNNKGYSKYNCRWATREIQAINKRIRKDNTSGYIGVYFNKINNVFTVKIKKLDNIIYLGTFNTAIEAGYAYDKYVIENNLKNTTNGLYKKELI